MGLLNKILAKLGLAEDKELLKLQFESLYNSYDEYEDEEVEVFEEAEPEPEIVVDTDPVVADYERMIRLSEDDAERADLEARLEKYKRKKGL